MTTHSTSIATLIRRSASPLLLFAALSACDGPGGSSPSLEASADGPLTLLTSRAEAPEAAVSSANAWLSSHPGHIVQSAESVEEVGGFEAIDTTFKGARFWLAKTGSASSAPSEALSLDFVPGDSAQGSAAKVNAWAAAHPQSRLIHVEAVVNTSGFRAVNSTFKGFRIWSARPL